MVQTWAMQQVVSKHKLEAELACVNQFRCELWTQKK